ncbi:MAG TPA: hypothetical protein PLT00_03115 [Verrucomicrobiota bacterium]|nr:MAG: hypothetical protein BWX84_03105 [Verrucomicrobia bacterium ADurb.Bin118]HPY30521.1 hypothetical protein [Verrucomicrobiota bacterium]HQB15685.1 hypothetical protein [Verrucomicrobiota bacterium]
MVGRLPLALGVGLAMLVRAVAAPFPAYQIGDVAEADIVTPVPLVLAGGDASPREAQAPSEPTQLVRLQVGAAAAVESDFLTTLTQLRSNFLVAMKAAYPLTKVTLRNLPSDRFRNLTNQFQRAHQSFPLDAEIVGIWALGGDHDALFQPFAKKLRGIMERPLLPDTAGEVIQPGERVHLIYGSGDADAAGENHWENNGWRVSPSNLVTLGRAREKFVEDFPAQERARAEFTASFLRENCSLESRSAPVARAASAKRTIHSPDRYAAGEVVVMRGQVVDERALAALALLREKAARGELPSAAAYAQQEVHRANRLNAWLLGGILALSGALVLLAAYVWRRRQPVTFLPVRLGGADKILLVPETAIVTPPPAPAEAVPSGFAAHLARLLGHSVVQRLFSQRAGLLDTQRLAAEEVSELEQRLEQLQTPLQERWQAYEQRIAELEKQLAQKGAENRELLKAKIDLTRRQLNAERARHDAMYN